jgi:hypothetical protein
VRNFLLTMVAAALAGCGAEIPDVPAGEPISYAAHLEPLVIARCLSCHETDDAKAKLVLERGIGYERLVGPRSVQVPEMVLVEPGDPNRSYLWLKLQHLTEKGAGMPRTVTGSKKLRTAELELYRRWIEGGAKP